MFRVQRDRSIEACHARVDHFCWIEMDFLLESPSPLNHICWLYWSNLSLYFRTTPPEVRWVFFLREACPGHTRSHCHPNSLIFLEHSFGFNLHSNSSNMFQKKFQTILTLGPFGPFGFRLTRPGTTSSAAWPFGCGLFSPGRRGKLATGAARGAEWCLRGLHVPGTGSEGGSWVKRTLKTWKTVNTVDVTAVEIITVSLTNPEYRMEWRHFPAKSSTRISEQQENVRVQCSAHAGPFAEAEAASAGVSGCDWWGQRVESGCGFTSNETCSCSSML